MPGDAGRAVGICGEGAVKVTERTKRILHYRRITKKWAAEGFEDLGENGGKLWEIYRGGRKGQHITEARVAPDGMSVWVKVEAWR